MDLCNSLDNYYVNYISLVLVTIVWFIKFYTALVEKCTISYALWVISWKTYVFRCVLFL